MLLRPNPSSGVPIYLQLMEQVKHGIETGALRPGEQLPGISATARAKKATDALRAGQTLVAGTVEKLRARGVTDEEIRRLFEAELAALESNRRTR